MCCAINTVRAIVSAGSFVSGLILFLFLSAIPCSVYMHEFCEQNVCVPSNPALSARLAVETDFLVATEATLICCKRSGDCSPLAGVVIKWIVELWFCSCLSAALLCWHCSRDGRPRGKCPFLLQGRVLTLPCPDLSSSHRARAL